MQHEPFSSAQMRRHVWLSEPELVVHERDMGPLEVCRMRVQLSGRTLEKFRANLKCL